MLNLITYSIIENDVIKQSGLLYHEAMRMIVSEEHQNCYIQTDPISWMTFLQIKYKELIDIPESVKLWVKQMDEGPMNEEQFASYVKLVDIETANEVNRMRSITPSGWFLYDILNWFRFWNKKEYEKMYSESITTDVFDYIDSI